MKVKSESEVTQLCLPLSDPMDCSLPGFSIHGIFQARVLEWVASAFSNSHFISGCFYYLVLLQGVSLSFEHSTLTKKTEKQKKKFLDLLLGTNLMPAVTLLKLANLYNHLCHLQKYQPDLDKGKVHREC